MNRLTSLVAPTLATATLLLGACGSLPSSPRSLVYSSANSCVDYARWQIRRMPPPRPVDAIERCRLYYDLIVMQDLERILGDKLQLRFTPLPCLADGPDCGWQQSYRELVQTRFELAFGDPIRQPNLQTRHESSADPTPTPMTPLPYDLIPASVQLEKARSLRGGLLEAVGELDRQIEQLSAAASPQ